MEHGIAEKAQKIEDISPGFEELEKTYEARTAAYDKQKKDIVGMYGTSHFAQISH